MKLKKYITEWDAKSNKPIKVGDMVNFHNDSKKLTMGKVVKISGDSIHIKSLDGGEKFVLTHDEVYQS